VHARINRRFSSPYCSFFFSFHSILLNASGIESQLFGAIDPCGFFFIPCQLYDKHLHHVARAREKSSALIAKEYYHNPISDLICGVFRHHPDILAGLDLSLDEYKAHGYVFPGWIQGSTQAADAMRKYFSDCDSALSAYIGRLVGGCSRAVLIDSGAFPEIKWRGLYFGRSLLPGHDASIVNDVLGIMFESDAYNPALPVTAFVRHRHILESLLEPNGSSIEEIPEGAHDAVARKLIAENENEILTANDLLYQYVIEYLSGEGRCASIADICARYQEAIIKMERLSDISIRL